MNLTCFGIFSLLNQLILINKHSFSALTELIYACFGFFSLLNQLILMDGCSCSALKTCL